MAKKGARRAEATPAGAPVAGPVGSTYDQGSERFARLLRKARRRMAPSTTAPDVARDVVLLLEQVHLAEHAQDRALVEDLSRRYGWAW